MDTKKRVRRVHTREFKAETVALVRTGGRNASQVARELGLADSLVRTWVHQAEVEYPLHEGRLAVVGRDMQIGEVASEAAYFGHRERQDRIIVNAGIGSS